MLRFLSSFGWVVVLLILGAFVWFAIEISKPRENLVAGTLTVDKSSPAPSRHGGGR